MNASRSDAIVFFGATGDLAYKQIFPALQALAQRHARHPCDRRRQSRLGSRLPTGTGPRQRRSRTERSTRRPSRSSPPCSATSTATTRTRPPSPRCAASSGLRAGRSTISRSRRALPDRRRPLGRVGLRRRSAHRRREAVRTRSLIRPCAQSRRCTTSSRRNRSSASTTTSARRRCRTSSTSGSPTPSSSRSGTEPRSRASRSRWARASASKAAEAFTTASARSATSSRTTCSRSPPSWRWSRRPATDHDDVRAAKAQLLRAIRPLDPAQVVRGQYRGYRDEPGVAPDSTVETFAALRLELDTWRWAGVPFLIRAGKKLPTTVPRSSSTSASPRSTSFGNP